MSKIQEQIRKKEQEIIKLREKHEQNTLRNLRKVGIFNLETELLLGVVTHANNLLQSKKEEDKEQLKFFRELGEKRNNKRIKKDSQID